MTELDFIFNIDAVTADEYKQPEYDFSIKESVLIHVCEDEYLLGLDVLEITSPKSKLGWASCEYENGALDYMLSERLGTWVLKNSGYYVVEGVTGKYYLGDGWSTDDDAEMFFDSVRKATPEEYEGYHE